MLNLAIMSITLLESGEKAMGGMKNYAITII